MLILLKLCTFVGTIAFSIVAAALCSLTIFVNAINPTTLKENLGNIALDKIIVKNFKNDDLIEKYGMEGTFEDILVDKIIPKSLSKEDGLKLLRNKDFQNKYIDNSYNNLLGLEVQKINEVETKKILDSLEIKTTDYKKISEEFNDNVSQVKIAKYENNEVYKLLQKIGSDSLVYLVVFIIASYILLAIFSLSITKPMQLVGYPLAIIGTIFTCGAILLNTFLGKLGPAYKELVTPLIKPSLLTYGIIYIVIGMVLAIIYEIINKRPKDNDKDLYSFTVAPQVGVPNNQETPVVTPSSFTPTGTPQVHPSQNFPNQGGNQIS